MAKLASVVEQSDNVKIGTMSDTIMSAMESTVRKNMLRYHVSQTMFCPNCYKCLDYRRAVSVDLFKHGELAKTYCMCGMCWDMRHQDIDRLIASRPEYTVEVIDGRLKTKQAASVKRINSKEQ